MLDLGLDVLFKGKNMIRLLGGLGVALKISLTSVLISLPLGILLGVLMTFRNPILKAVLRLYLEAIRILPQMVLLFLVYFGTTRAWGWNLSGETASVIVVVGPSGCGKSTLLRCLNGLEPTQSGRVRLGNETVAYGGKNLTQLRQRIGMVFQSYELFPHLTVLDNILLAPTKVQKRPKDEVQKEAEALLDRVGLLAKKNSYPRELSGGQKQRVAIVRALCMHPEILLFDEVTAALDPEMVREVLDVMLDLAKQGRTMIIVTHEMQFARAIANRVIFLDGGKIVEEAVPADFFDHPKTKRAQRFLRTFTFDAVK